MTLDVVLRDVLMPYLHELGERWERGEASVAQEHFASNLVRGRLMALARSWDRGGGPRALLACAEGELHDLPLVGFGLALREHGWRISYLGADTPVASVVETTRALTPDAVVVSGTSPASSTRSRPGSARSRSTPPSTSPARRPTRRSHAGRTRPPAGDVVLAAETLAAERR